MITSQTYKSRSGSEYVWVDLQTPTVDEVNQTAEKYNIHPLAVEEILEGGERPRIQDFENHTLIVLQPLTSMVDEPEFSGLEVILSKSWVLTFHKRALKEIDEVKQTVASGARAANQGPDFLFYTILSHVVDSYFDLADAYEARIDGLEETIFKPGQSGTLEKLLSVRRNVVTARRVLSYTRELVASMLREDFYDLDDQDERYYRDAHFELSHLLEIFETFREFLADLRDSYMSMVSLSLNEVMKKLTVVGTIALPLIVVSGIFGMNLPGLPGLGDQNAAIIAIIGMTIFTLTIVAYFRMVRWL